MTSTKYFLIGMPASGKSTIGKLIAKQLGYKFIDLDELIVEQEGLAITEIFRKKGEAYFRKIERKQLQDLINRNDGFILATGGGAPCFFNNMELMNTHGVTIFLNVAVDDLFKKLAKRGTQKRPLLKNISRSDLLSELTNKYNDRKKFYNKSKISIEQNIGKITDRVNQVIFAIKTLEK